MLLRFEHGAEIRCGRSEGEYLSVESLWRRTIVDHSSGKLWKEDPNLQWLARISKVAFPLIVAGALMYFHSKTPYYRMSKLLTSKRAIKCLFCFSQQPEVVEFPNPLLEIPLKEEGGEIIIPGNRALINLNLSSTFFCCKRAIKTFTD